MKNIEIRTLKEKDFYNGFLKVLRRVNNIYLHPSEGKNEWKKIKNAEKRTTVYVAVDEEKIVGTATLKIDTRFGREFGRIEDVATDKEYEGNQIAKTLVNKIIDELTLFFDCYKVIVNCKKEYKGFYKKLGFKQSKEVMRIDL